MRVDRITDSLFEHRSVTGIVVDHTYQIIIHHVRSSQMHIMTHRQVQRITGLIGIHDVLIFLQHRGVTLCIVEREIDVVGEVREDIAEGVTKTVGQFQIGLSGQLRTQLCGHVRHQAQLIVELRLLHAVALVLIDHRAAPSRQQVGTQENTCARHFCSAQQIYRRCLLVDNHSFFYLH